MFERIKKSRKPIPTNRRTMQNKRESTSTRHRYHWPDGPPSRKGSDRNTHSITFSILLKSPFHTLRRNGRESLS